VPTARCRSTRRRKSRRTPGRSDRDASRTLIEREQGRLLHRTPCPAAIHPDDVAVTGIVLRRLDHTKWCSPTIRKIYLHALPRDLGRSCVYDVVLARRRTASGVDCRRERLAQLAELQTQGELNRIAGLTSR
jgi:hypothetical protein